MPDDPNTFEANEGQLLITVGGLQRIDVRKPDDRDDVSVVLLIKDRECSWLKVDLDLPLPIAKAFRDALYSKIEELEAVGFVQHGSD